MEFHVNDWFVWSLFRTYFPTITRSVHGLDRAEDRSRWFVQKIFTHVSNNDPCNIWYQFKRIKYGMCYFIPCPTSTRGSSSRTHRIDKSDIKSIICNKSSNFINLIRNGATTHPVMWDLRWFFQTISSCDRIHTIFEFFEV